MSSDEFRYVALDAKGAKIRGLMGAASRHDVMARLRAEGLSPISVGASTSSSTASFYRRRLGPRRLAEWLRAIGLMLAAGAPLAGALAMVRQQNHGVRLRRLTEILEREIAGGQGVAAALTVALQSNAAFVPGLVAAGEASGDLAGALEKAAAQLEQDATITEEFWTALSYPAFIVVASVAAMLVILLLVTPAIAPLLVQERAAISAPLSLLIGLSDFLVAHGALLGVSVLVTTIAMVIAAGLGILTRPAESILLDGPASRLTRALIFGRFASVFGHLLEAGVSAPEAFRLAGGGTSTSLARLRLSRAAARLFEGTRVAAALADCPGMPPTITRMAGVGEETGALGAMIAKAGDLEQQSALRTLKRLAGVLGPAMIVLLGGLIGLVMGGLLSGVATLGDAVLQ